jgi:hypothetical protein
VPYRYNEERLAALPKGGRARLKLTPADELNGSVLAIGFVRALREAFPSVLLLLLKSGHHNLC